MEYAKILQEYTQISQEKVKKQTNVMAGRHFIQKNPGGCRGVKVVDWLHKKNNSRNVGEIADRKGRSGGQLMKEGFDIRIYI